jgi:sugar phosphate isomerase/epimerase
MRFSVQQTLVPGDTLADKLRRAADYGFEAVELASWGFDGPMPDYRDEIESALAASGVQVSTLCSSGKDDFVHPDPEEREARLDRLVAMLELADALGAAGVVALPIRPPVHLPDLSPVADEHTLITELASSALERALARTSGGRAAIYLEPLNRYEAYYLRTLNDAAALCRFVDQPRAQMMGDLFHMNIEEAHMTTSLRVVSAHLGHIHLADTNRLLPGHGHMDFTNVFRALHEIEYEGWMALECGVPGDPDATLPRALEVLKDAWVAAGAA